MDGFTVEDKVNPLREVRMWLHRFRPSGRRLLMSALALAAISSPALAQADNSSCERAISAVQRGSPRTADIDLITGGCRGHAIRVHPQALQAARDVAAERPLRLVSLRVLVTGIRPEAELSRSDADAEVRRASLVLRQALVYADPTLAALEPNAVRLVAGCADLVRLESTSDISVPYVMRVEGTAFNRTIWLMSPRNGETNRLELALPAGIVTVTVADRMAARLDARPGLCP